MEPRLARAYTPEDDAFLVAHYRVDMSIETIAERLERTRGSISRRVWVLKRQELIRDEERKSRYNSWSTESDDWLYCNWGRVEDPKVCEELKRSYPAIMQRAWQIGALKSLNR